MKLLKYNKPLTEKATNNSRETNFLKIKGIFLEGKQMVNQKGRTKFIHI